MIVSWWCFGDIGLATLWWLLAAIFCREGDVEGEREEEEGEGVCLRLAEGTPADAGMGMAVEGMLDLVFIAIVAGKCTCLWTFAVSGCVALEVWEGQ